MSELLPCPFCGGEAETLTAESMHGGNLYGVMCANCAGRSDVYDTEAEAIAAWNSRTPIEYDGWFYLPKPKVGIVDYGEPEITRTENGYRVRQFADVVDEAARKWGDELGDYVMKRICEVWNSRAERTCKHDRMFNLVKRECDGKRYSWRDMDMPSYCPNCGARVVE